MRAFILRHRSWFVGGLITVSVPFLEALVETDLTHVTDWRAWLVGIGAGTVREFARWLLRTVIQRAAGAPA